MTLGITILLVEIISQNDINDNISPNKNVDKKPVLKYYIRACSVGNQAGALTGPFVQVSSQGQEG